MEATRGTGVHSAGQILVSFQLRLTISLPGLLGLEQSHAPEARLRSAQRRPPPCQQSHQRPTVAGYWLAARWVNTISFNPCGISDLHSRCDCPTVQLHKQDLTPRLDGQAEPGTAAFSPGCPRQTAPGSWLSLKLNRPVKNTCFRHREVPAPSSEVTLTLHLSAETPHGLSSPRTPAETPGSPLTSWTARAL